MRLLAPYRRILGFPRGDRRLAWALVLGNLMVACVQFLDPVLFGRVIGLLTRSAELPPDALWGQAARLLGAWVAIGATGIATNVSVALFADRLAHRNRLAAMRRFFAHVLTLPPAFHTTAHSGRLQKLMLAGTDAMFWFWLSFFREQLSTIIAALLLLPLTLLLNWRLALVVIALVLLFCAFAALVSRRTHAGQTEAQRHHLALAIAAQDAIANVVMLQAFDRLAAERRRFGAIAAEVIAHQFPVLTWWAVASASARAASTVAVITIVVAGTLLHLQGRASVGEIVSFMGFATLLIGRFDSAMQFTARLFYELPQLRGYFEAIDAASSVPERPGAQALYPGADGRVGEVTFEDVSFAFPGGPPALQGIGFTARPGSVVALVGHTGAGKSTAMALLQRLWDPTRGRILIDGQDIAGVRLDSLRGAIGVVFQDAMLLNRSIRENLLVGKPDATAAELDAACRLADAEEFIVRQPQGFDTIVGEHGATLSGGQKQRLAIARAALKDPRILILDEATSALDAETEARVGTALAALMRARTTFVIAHRLSTVRAADEILVLEAGRIVERGRFEQLRQAGGRFAELVATQLAADPAARAAE
jgi:ATP-binding cassette, subfamily B, beta-glucan exporter